VGALVPLLLSAAFAAVAAPAALRAFATAGWTRENFRGRALPFPAGAIAMTCALLALGVLAALDQIAGTHLLTRENALDLFGALDRFSEGNLAAPSLVDPGDAYSGSLSIWTDLAWPALPGPVLLLGVGVALLGLLDDLLGTTPCGLRDHVATTLRGAPSTGAVKALGITALALYVLSGQGLTTGRYLLAVAVVVLATHVFNLLDVRPGRAAKAWVLLAAGLLIGTTDLEPLRGIGLLAGALLVLGAFDLRERAMLGDTGAGVLGALAGLWLVAALHTTGEAVALAILLAITLAGEFFSLSAAIDMVPPLRALDSLGRRSDA
jgi:UDP-GlcNAc:undecaprenyl-phosphate/decaprenyl-phosphate GlcNAc-1-phosphate transferase